MGNKVVFQFEELSYQEKAINSVVELFRGLPKEGSEIYSGTTKKTGLYEKDPVRNKSIVTGNRLLENLRKVQLENELFSDNKVEDNNFTIEMETGTGKTYVYLRTAIRLFREYGFKKFIIVVPTVAIRKGVEKSIEQLREHFKRLEGIDIGKHSFIYDSDNLGKVSTNFVESNDLSICVMNIQSFNKNKVNKIRKDDEYGKILWNDIKFLRPIIIIDEPQKIEGQKGKKSKSLEALDELEPLFTLRYSATHKNLYNQIYKLDSYQAYQQNLVKKIKVKTINSNVSKDYKYIRYIKFTSDLKARVEIFYQEQGGIIKFKSFDVLGNTSLEELSGGLKQYSGMYIAENPHKEKPLKIVDTNGELLYLKVGESNNKVDSKEAIRIQIRLAIQNHFEKQLSILKKKKFIKILTLFFIDEVAKVRDEKAEDGRGEYLRIFDEEYTNILWKYRKDIERYKEFFPNYEEVLQVREGYFARDKKNNIVEIEDWDSSKDDDIKGKSKSQEDIDRGVSLILEKKDELISFREPLSFIFSHSALREGWDNPNVFTLCTLKQGSSNIAKKQEIGRGLRLPVDINGNRCLDTEINELTVIANDSYENFSSSLQNDFNEDRDVNEVTADVLIKTLRKAGVSKSQITPKLVDKLKEELISNKIIVEKNILNKNIDEMREALENIKFTDEVLQEYVEEIREEFIKAMSDRGTSRVEIKNGDNPDYVNDYTSLVDEEVFEEIFEGLANKLTKKTFYKCQIDDEKYIEESIALINEELRNYTKATTVRITEASGGYEDTEEFILKKEVDFDKDIEITETVVEKSDFEIVQYIMYHTMLPRLAIFRILSGIEKRFALNSQDVLETVSQLLLTKLNETKAKNIISYEVVDDYEIDRDRIFAMDNISEEDFDKEWKVFEARAGKTNSMNKYYKLDSKGEKEFAKQLEQNENILLFTKLKKGGFVIDTPYGNYSPDWAIVYRNPDEDSDKKIGVYFIAESKIDKEWNDLSGEEQDKINCGKLHFKAVSELVRFDWIKNYQDFKKKFGVKDSI
ncbi:DEAD/DEAH box helicase family protein [Fusobacterium necrogenes]|uniref:restriction endonuclease n=1 Tax=Fusobacterium necrogenes TaxID=858 RepID=UPI00255CCC55|nr:DEAD/DEAH box helicase family protein [Fusobacterium necrogenes]